MVFVFELLDDEAGHFRLGEGLIGEDASVLRNAGVSLGLEGTESFEKFPFVGGWLAFFEEPLMQAGVFSSLAYLARRSWFFRSSSRARLWMPLRVAMFSIISTWVISERFFSEESFEFLLQGDEGGVTGIEVATEAFPSAA